MLIHSPYHVASLIWHCAINILLPVGTSNTCCLFITTCSIVRSDGRVAEAR